MPAFTWTCKTFDQLSRDELYEILRLRSAVFVVEQQCVYQDVDNFDQAAHHVMGLTGGGDHLLRATAGTRHQIPDRLHRPGGCEPG